MARVRATIKPTRRSPVYAQEKARVAGPSRPFAPPKSGRIAVKVINHYGDEALRVFRVP